MGGPAAVSSTACHFLGRLPAVTVTRFCLLPSFYTTTDLVVLVHHFTNISHYHHGLVGWFSRRFWLVHHSSGSVPGFTTAPALQPHHLSVCFYHRLISCTIYYHHLCPIRVLPATAILPHSLHATTFAAHYRLQVPPFYRMPTTYYHHSCHRAYLYHFFLPTITAFGSDPAVVVFLIRTGPSGPYITHTGPQLTPCHGHAFLATCYHFHLPTWVPTGSFTVLDYIPTGLFAVPHQSFD